MENGRAENRTWCSHCQKPTMKNRGPLFALSNIDWWECTTCKMVERYRNNDSRAQARSNAEDRGTAKEEATMSEGTLESLKQLREKQTKTDSKKRQPKAKATEAPVHYPGPQQPTESAESKKMKTQKKEQKKQAPKTGERKAVKKVVAKVEREAKKTVKKEFSTPDSFIRSFEGKDHIVKKTKSGWSVDGKDAGDSLRAAMIAILKAHKKDVGHRAASYFFANVKSA